MADRTAASSRNADVSGVSMRPGDTQLTRRVGPYSRAADRVSAITAAFAAE